MAKKIDKQRCITPVFRVSFPKVFKAEAFEDNAPKFSITMLFPKNRDMKALIAAARAAKIDKWGEDEKKWPKNLRTPFRDGNEKQDLEGYADMIFVNASNKLRPEVVDRQLNVITEESDEFYAGCQATAALRAFAYDMKGNRGVSFSLEAIQKIGEGERFSGRKRASDLFSAMGDDEDTTDNDLDDETAICAASGF